MTCIVGLVEGKKVYIGGDSAGVSGTNLTVRTDGKVFHNGPFLFGFTSSFRMGQLLQYDFIPPKHDTDLTDMQYLVTVFVNALRECFKGAGFATKNSDAEVGGNFLVAYRGHLYEIHRDYQIEEAADGYNACGCGEQYATGSLFATEGQEAEKRVKTALRAAERFSADVRGPFVVEVLE